MDAEDEMASAVRLQLVQLYTRFVIGTRPAQWNLSRVTNAPVAEGATAAQAAQAAAQAVIKLDAAVPPAFGAQFDTLMGGQMFNGNTAACDWLLMHLGGGTVDGTVEEAAGAVDTVESAINSTASTPSVHSTIDTLEELLLEVEAIEMRERVAGLIEHALCTLAPLQRANGYGIAAGIAAGSAAGSGAEGKPSIVVWLGAVVALMQGGVLLRYHRRCRSAPLLHVLHNFASLSMAEARCLVEVGVLTQLLRLVQGGDALVDAPSVDAGEEEVEQEEQQQEEGLLLQLISKVVCTCGCLEGCWEGNKNEHAAQAVEVHNIHTVQAVEVLHSKEYVRAWLQSAGGERAWKQLLPAQMQAQMQHSGGGQIALSRMALSRMALSRTFVAVIMEGLRDVMEGTKPQEAKEMSKGPEQAYLRGLSELLRMEDEHQVVQSINSPLAAHGG
jgi:hypothetical protein